jgi:uncharacterized membrane protein YkoI
MTSLPKRLAALAAVCAACATCSHAAERQQRAESAAGVSLEDATAIVRQAYSGRVVSAAAARKDGEPGYRIRVDVRGTVKTLFVDRRGRIHDLAEQAK